MRHPLNPGTVPTALGPLERRVIDTLWTRADAATIRNLAEAFPGVAYTTLMTTADRLFRKGLLDRVRDGRAFRYRPRFTRAEFDLHLAASAMVNWLDDDPTSLRPLVSLFVDEVSRRDESMLDELERLVRQKRDGQR